jgi:uncharacterized protein
VGGPPGDLPVEALTWFFFEQKFITLFSILFGAGLAIRFDRAHARGEPFVGRLLRRQAVLLVIGLLHLHLLFYGDILTTYALIGSFAWLACGLGQRALLALAAACFAGACAIWGWRWLDSGALELMVLPLIARWVELLDNVPTLVGLKPIGLIESWGFDLSRLGLTFYVAAYFGLTIWITYSFYVLACFLVGMYLLRRGVFHEPTAHHGCLNGVIIAGLAVGLPLNAAYVIARTRHPEAYYLLLFIGLAAPPLALAYLALLLRWAASGRLPRLQRWLRATGRLALTNYLSQSVLMYWLFTRIGGENISRTGALGIVVLIWLFQIALSAAWVRLFRTGPMEWLWRRLSGDRGRGFVRPPGEAAEVS